MPVDVQAVLVSAAVTAAVALAGIAVFVAVSRRHPARAARIVPAVLVLSLACGVLSASRLMLFDENLRTLAFVLLAGAPIALGSGLLLARQVQRIQDSLVREQAERDALVATEASRRETIRWLSHDLRTPLTGIRLLAESIVVGSVETAGAAERITAEVDRLDAMVEDLTELSRLHAPHPEDLQLVSVADLASDAAGVIRPFVAARGQDLVVGRCDSQVVAVLPGALTRAITNLLRNAIDHTPAGGRIELTVSSEAGLTVVTVADQCGGIPEAELPQLFAPGWRGSHARPGGMGLGLAIVAEVARLHGGTATIDNAPQRGGCQARLGLPVTLLTEQ